MIDPLDNYPAEVMEPIADQIIDAFIVDNPAAVVEAITTAQRDGGIGWITSLIFALAGRAALADHPDDHPDDQQTATEIFIADYTAMRNAGLKHKQIAATMGVSMDTLNLRLERNKCRVPEDDERVLIELMDRLITAGRAFSVNDFPYGADRGHIARVFNAAEREGRIVRAGTARRLADNGDVVRWIPAHRVAETMLRSAS